MFLYYSLLLNLISGLGSVCITFHNDLVLSEACLHNLVGFAGLVLMRKIDRFCLGSLSRTVPIDGS